MLIVLNLGLLSALPPRERSQVPSLPGVSNRVDQTVSAFRPLCWCNSRSIMKGIYTFEEDLYNNNLIFLTLEYVKTKGATDNWLSCFGVVVSDFSDVLA